MFGVSRGEEGNGHHSDHTVVHGLCSWSLIHHILNRFQTLLQILSMSLFLSKPTVCAVGFQWTFTAKVVGIDLLHRITTTLFHCVASFIKYVVDNILIACLYLKLIKKSAKSD